MSAQPSLLEIIQATAAEMGLTIGQITGASQESAVSLARERCFYLAHRHRHDLSLSMIARPFKRDHSTVSRAIDRVAMRIMDGDQLELTVLARIQRRLEAVVDGGNAMSLIAQLDQALDVATQALEQAREIRGKLLARVTS